MRYLCARQGHILFFIVYINMCKKMRYKGSNYVSSAQASTTVVVLIFFNFTNP